MASFLGIDFGGRSRQASEQAAGDRKAKPQMQVDAFERTLRLSSKALEGMKVTAVHCHGENLIYVGASSGHLCVYDLQQGARPTVKTRLGSRSISQIDVVPALGMLIALCDGRLSFHELKTLRKVHSANDAAVARGIAALNKKQRVSIFAAMQDKPHDLAVALRRGKRLLICEWNARRRAYMQDKEYMIPDAPLCATWFGMSEYLALGYRREYSIIYAPDGKVTEVTAPVEGGSICAHAIDREIVVSTTHDLGVFLGSNGHPANRTNVQFGASPMALRHIGEYMLALLPTGAVEIVSLLELKKVQTVSIKDPICCAANESRAVIAGSEGVYVLTSTTPNAQVDQLLRRGYVEEAERLLSRGAPSGTDLAAFHAKAGWALIPLLRFRDAFNNLSDGNADPRKVLKLFPGLQRKALSARAPSGPKRGIHSMLARASDPTKKLESARLHLARFLWAFRSRAASDDAKALEPLREEKARLVAADDLEGAMRVKARIADAQADAAARLCDVDTALLVLFVSFTWDKKHVKALPPAEQDLIDQLPFASLERLLFPQNACALDECAAFLSRGLDRPQEHDLAMLYASKRKYREALGIWHDLSTGTRRERGQDGIQPTIDLLARLDFDPRAPDPAPASLLWEHAVWVLKTAPKAGMGIFTSDRRSTPLDADEILAFLQRLAPDPQLDFVGTYLEYLTKTDTRPKYHDALAARYYRGFVEADEAGRSAARARLLSFLREDEHYTESKALSLIRQTDLHEEMVVVLTRLGLYRAVLQVFVYKLRDHARAERYCIDTGRESETLPSAVAAGGEDRKAMGAAGGVPTRAELFSMLLQIYMDSSVDGSGGSRGGSVGSGTGAADPGASLIDRGDTSDDFLAEGMRHLLDNCAAHLNSVETLRLLPGELPLKAVETFVARVLRSALARRRNGQIMSKLVRAERFQAKTRCIVAKKKAFVIDTKTECAVCRKKIGDSFFSAHPPPGGLHPERDLPDRRKWTIVHRGCAKKFEAMQAARTSAAGDAGRRSGGTK